MKRKNTKIYKELVERYCRNRYEVESRSNDVAEHNKVIAEHHAAFNDLDGVLKANDYVRTWYKEFIKMHELSIVFATQVIDHFSESVEKDGETLRNDYGADLDVVFKEFQERENGGV